MNLSKILILAALSIVVVKFVLSLGGKNDITWLNQLVSVILVVFVVFELFQLGQVLWLHVF